MNAVFKQSSFYIIAISFVLNACSTSDPAAELESLKKQRDEITEKINQLQAGLDKQMPVDKNIKTKSVLVTKIQAEVFSHYVQVQGKVDAEESVNVSSKTGGEIRRILVEEGDQVRAGQVLAEMDNQVMTQGIAELKSQLAFASTVFEKQKALWDQKIGSEIQYLTAKNNKEALENKLKTLQEQDEMSKIKAPVSGIIDAVDIKMGQMIAPGMPALRIVNLSKLTVKADVAEAYASQIKTGKKVLIYFPDLNKEVSAYISYAAKVINPITRAFSVEIDLPNAEEYRANMIAVVKIIDYTKDQAMTVPVNVIASSENSRYVLVAEKQADHYVAKKQTVKVGSVYQGKAEILDGLQEGQYLISTGYQSLNEGERVKF